MTHRILFLSLLATVSLHADWNEKQVHLDEDHALEVNTRVGKMIRGALLLKRTAQGRFQYFATPFSADFQPPPHSLGDIEFYDRYRSFEKWFAGVSETNPVGPGCTQRLEVAVRVKKTAARNRSLCVDTLANEEAAWLDKWLSAFDQSPREVKRPAPPLPQQKK